VTSAFDPKQRDAANKQEPRRYIGPPGCMRFSFSAQNRVMFNGDWILWIPENPVPDMDIPKTGPSK
jgi:hypothetical protein